MEKDKDFSEYPKEIKKVRVKTTPWDNARRQAEPPTKLLENDQDIFESTMFDISITDLPADVLHDQEEEGNYDFPKEFVRIQKTEKPYEKSVLKYGQGSIKLKFPLRVIRNLVVYTLHIKKDGNWTKSYVKKKVGSKTFEIDLTDFSIASIFLTSSRIYDDVSLGPEKESVYKNDLSKDEIITFPQGSVSTTTQVKVSTVSIDRESKKKRLTDESGIEALSNIAYIHTNEKLRHKAALTFKLDELFEMVDSPLETFVFHCNEKGLEIVDIPVQCVSESKALYQIEVDTFSGYGVGRRRANLQRDVCPKIAHAMDMNYHRCKILLFIEKDDTNVSLWSEIVPAEEDIVEKTFQKREEGKDNLIALRVCRSPTVMVKNLENIRIVIPENVGIIVTPSALIEPPVLSYDQESYENVHRLSISRNNRHQNNELAIVQYRRVQARKDLLHQAHFGADKFFRGTHQNRPKRTPFRTEHYAMFDEPKSLSILSKQLTVGQMTELGSLLNLTVVKMDELIHKHDRYPTLLKESILHSWLENDSRCSFKQKVENLTKGLETLELRTISEVVIEVANESRAFKLEDFNTS